MWWALLLVLGGAWAAVETVEPKGYEAFLAAAAEEEQWVLLDFFAPWCGHCKRLNPVLDTFAAVRPTARVGKVDATKHKALAKEHGVSGYPSLRFRAAGEAKFRDYKGARDAQALERLDDRLRSPAVQTAIDVSVDPYVAFAVAPTAAPETWEVFEAVAIDRRHEASFARSASVADDGVYLVDGDGTYRYEGELEFSRLKKWVKKHNVRLWNDPLGPSTFRKVGDSRLVAAVVLDPDAPNTTLAAEVAAALPGLRERLAGGVLDGVRWSDYVATFGVDASGLPCLIVIDLPGDKFWLNDHAAPAAFLAAVLDGRLSPKYHGIRGFPDRALRFYATHRLQVFAGLLALLLLVSLTIYFSKPPPDHPKTD